MNFQGLGKKPGDCIYQTRNDCPAAGQNDKRWGKTYSGD